MKNRRLSDDLKFYRAERPDDAILDKFINDARRLEKVNKKMECCGNCEHQAGNEDEYIANCWPCDKNANWKLETKRRVR